jgi:hypothetical protein
MGCNIVTLDAEVASQPPRLCGSARELNSAHLFVIRVVANKRVMTELSYKVGSSG